LAATAAAAGADAALLLLPLLLVPLLVLGAMHEVLLSGGNKRCKHLLVAGADIAE
jgi:hypothetical protein